MDFFDESGAAAVEFALVLPMLAMLMCGIFSFSIALNNNEMLTGAVNTGARQLARSRGASTPYADIVTLVGQAAAGLEPSKLSVTMTVNGQSCTGDSGESGCAALLTVGAPASVTASYPCAIVVLGIDYAPNCTLSQTMTGRVE